MPRSSRVRGRLAQPRPRRLQGNAAGCGADNAREPAPARRWCRRVRRLRRTRRRAPPGPCTRRCRAAPGARRDRRAPRRRGVRRLPARRGAARRRGGCSPSPCHARSTSARGAAASAAGVGHRAMKASYIGITRATCVCCNMISLTSTAYASSTSRHGRSRRCASYQSSTAWTLNATVVKTASARRTPCPRSRS